MKEWTIKTDQEEYRVLLVNPLTIFKGTEDSWAFLLEDFTNFFDSSKSSAIQIIEDQTPLAKRDFRFYIFSPEDSSNTSFESAIQYHKKRFLDLLEFSPFYVALTESWEELSEEVEFLSQSQSSSSLHFSLTPINKEWIENRIVASTANSRLSVSKVDQVLLQLDAIVGSAYDKKLIIAIQLPLSFFTEVEQAKFLEKLRSDKRGILYLLFCEDSSFKGENVLYKNSIHNYLKCYEVRNDLRKKLPFEWDGEKFDQAANLYVSLVDKYREETVFLNEASVDNAEVFVYVYSLFLLTYTPVIVDSSIFSPHLQKYFDSLLIDEV